MKYSESVEQAHKFTQAALVLMESQDIPANPTNVTIWFEYVSGRNPELVLALDALRAKNIAFSAKHSEEIYARFFGDDREAKAIQEASSQIEASVSRVLQHIDKAGRNSSAYGEKLVSFSQNCEHAAGDEEVGSLVREILLETQQITEMNRALAARMSESSREIADLKQRLVDTREEARTDWLTGLLNRKYFEIRLREVAEESAKSGEALSVLMIDIDHFKTFNDTYGHRIGDQALKVIARLLKDNLKGQDTPVRYGGEEFCVILPQTNLTNAASVAANIRRTSATARLKNRKTGEYLDRVTLSIGVAQYRPGEPLEDVVQRADEALYRAKDMGRDRVVCEDASNARSQSPPPRHRTSDRAAAL